MATEDIPILGLWERTFSQDLLWMRVPSPVACGPKHASYIPSWPWLSCSHGIWFDFWISKTEEEDLDIIEDHVKLLQWAVDWTSEPWTSDIKSAALIVNGPVREIELNQSVGTKGDNNPPYFDAYVLGRPNLNRPRSDIIDCNVQFDDKPREGLETYLCMLLRSYDGTHKMKETFHILERHSGTDSFRRIGIGNFINDSPTFDLAIRRTVKLV